MRNIDGNGNVTDLCELPPQNEILFVLDSVGWTEFNMAKAPNIKGMRYVHKAYSYSFYTLPSVESMFRGAVPQPADKCIWPYGRYSNTGENTVIPMTLRNRGYNTYLLSSNLLVSIAGTTVGPDVISCHDNMFEYGFSNNMNIFSSGPLVEWFLSQVEEPFFAFFLVIETHTPYLGKDKKQGTQIQAIELVDNAIGTLKQGIKDKNFKYRTRAIITSDHSEAWSDDNKKNRGHNPMFYHEYMKNDRMKRLTEVFMARGPIT